MCVPSTMKPKGYISPSAFEYNPTHLVIQSSLNVKEQTRKLQRQRSQHQQALIQRKDVVENSFNFNKIANGKNPILCGKLYTYTFFLLLLCYFDINLSSRNRHIGLLSNGNKHFSVSFIFLVNL